MTDGATPTIASLRPCAERHLAAYTDPAAGFAFGSYDRWYSTPDRLTPLDCLAANLLSLRLGHPQVLPLFHPGPSPATSLRDAMQLVLDRTVDGTGPRFLDLDSIDDEPFRMLRQANTLTKDVRGWTAVTVCKILHRLRPDFVPLYDSVLRGFYRTRGPAAFFTALLVDLSASQQWLTAISDGVRTLDDRPLSVLRAADIVIWHHCHVGCAEGPTA
ncbi:DUF6308 family protein [Micromonospora sp. NBC_01699]|uniref:DUF6308 family protein n=1 Tax=Micromonospora sp. NBC_01699 TaxID=2975984 RepID=UPI002E31E87B|nr:DUF6308 family protein [Micromonospora sp. NBC_01699]